jgi:hypothetical protein
MLTLLLTAYPSWLERVAGHTCAMGGVCSSISQVKRAFANPEVDLR